MISLLRGRSQELLGLDTNALFMQDESMMLKQQAELKLAAGKQTIRERLIELLGEKQIANVSTQGLYRLALYRVPVLGGVFVEQGQSAERPPSRIAFDLTHDDCLEIATHDASHDDRYRYVRSSQGIHFELKDMRYPLTSPIAQEGLVRLEHICEQLGSICLSRAS